MSNVEKPDDWTDEQFREYFGSESDTYDDSQTVTTTELDAAEIQDDGATTS